MSAPNHVENIRFEVVVDPQETMQRLEGLLEIAPSDLKSSLTNWGLALHYASQYLDRRTLTVLNDGKLYECNEFAQPTKRVEIDFWELDNFGSLLMLGRLKNAQTKGRSTPPDFFEKQDFRLHGHEKGHPTAIYGLGFDKDGFFLVDRRKSWEATRLFETTPLP